MPRSARLIFFPPPRSNQPSARCKSLWQTPAARTFSRTSLPAGCGVGCSLSCKGWPQTQTWNMRIWTLSRIFVGASEPQSAAPVTTWLNALHLHVDRRPALDSLINDAIPLGELKKLIELVLRGIGIEIEAQPDLRETNRCILGNAEGAAEIEIAFGRHVAGLERNIERGRHRLHRDASAGDQRFEQHIAGAKLEPGSAGRRMQARDGQRATGLDLAGNIAVVEGALGLQSYECRLRIALVALLDRRLHRTQFARVHTLSPLRIVAANLQAGCTRAQERLPPHGRAGTGMFKLLGHALTGKRAVQRHEHTRLDVIEGGRMA